MASIISEKIQNFKQIEEEENNIYNCKYFSRTIKGLDTGIFLPSGGANLNLLNNTQNILRIQLHHIK